MDVAVELWPRREQRTLALPEGSTGFDLMSALGLHPDAHILARGDEPIPIDERLRAGESLRIIQVVSGGNAF